MCSLGHIFFGILSSTYYPKWELVKVAFRAKMGYRILWFTSVKAVLNTLMVLTGFKNPGHFKFTPKQNRSGDGTAQHVVGETHVRLNRSRLCARTQEAPVCRRVCVLPRLPCRAPGRCCCAVLQPAAI